MQKSILLILFLSSLVLAVDLFDHHGGNHSRPTRNRPTRTHGQPTKENPTSQDPTDNDDPITTSRGNNRPTKGTGNGPSPTAKPVPGCTYNNEQKWSGQSFYDQFNFFTAGDPTHGHVKFVNKSYAINSKLISWKDNGQVYMGVDYTTRGGPRKAVRLESKTTFVNGLVIIDLDHMPGSICGSWPAFWTVGTSWPNNGEIDIIEGVNKANTNAMTLHTNKGCTMGSRQMTGKSSGSNCDVAATGNSGCGVQNSKRGSYGDSFNQNGGGAYAMERSETGIKVWFWPKGQYPSDLLSGQPNTCNWGNPEAHFPFGGSCPSSHFGAQSIIFDITFCGDWAGAVFNQQCGGMGSCTDYVANNPSAFKEAYWLINSLRVFSK